MDPSELLIRPKRTGDVYRGMTVNKALTILHLSQHEYNKLDDEAFKEAFSMKPPGNEGEEEEAAVRVKWGLAVAAEETIKKKKKKKSKVPVIRAAAVDPWNPVVHEAFQFLLKKRAANNDRIRAKFGGEPEDQGVEEEGEVETDTDKWLAGMTDMD